MQRGLDKSGSEFWARIAELETRISELEAERDRADDALQRVIDHFDLGSELYTSDWDMAAGMADIARAALAARQKGEGEHVR